MDFAAWEPTYEAILDDMGYPREADEDAARRLDRLLEGHDAVTDDDLRLLFQDERVVVFGAAPHLADDVGIFETYQGTTVAADAALPVVRDAGADVDLVTTDLDGAPEDQVKANAGGVPVAVHAHGDNRDLLGTWVPRFEGPLLGTCQSSPGGLERVRNVGGFTDGDRACCLAVHFGARRLVLVGWDFVAAEGDKRRKLRWAKRIVEGLDVPVDVV